MILTVDQVENEIAMEMDPKEYEAIAADIHSDKSPVGIDAKKTHIYIIHMLQRIEERLKNVESRLGDLEQN